MTSSIERIKELAVQRHNLALELSKVNSQLLIHYEMLFLAVVRKEVDIEAVAKYLHDVDVNALKKGMPVLSNHSSVVMKHAQQSEVVQSKPVEDKPIDTSNIQPHTTGDDDVDDKDPTLEKKSKIEQVKNTERYKQSVAMNERNLQEFNSRYEKMTPEKRAEFKKNNLDILLSRLKQLESLEDPEDPNKYVAHHMSLDFYRQCLKCLEHV